MLEPSYGEGVEKELDLVEADNSRQPLWNAIVAALNLVCDHPDSAEARRYSLPFPSGRTAWRVPINCRTEDADWVLIWYPDGPDAVILYVGAWPPAST